MMLFSFDMPWAGETAIRLLFALVAVLLPAGTTVYLYLFKMVSFMQSRLGPMEAGPYGSMQLLAEVGKSLQKEDIFPAKADRTVFALAPYVVLMSTFLLVVAIPFGPDAYFANLDTGVFYALAVTSISVIGILMAGWGSASKYSLLGGLRAAGQLIAYELPLVLAVVGVVIQAGTLSLSGIIQAQATGEIFGFGGIGNPYILTQGVGFLIFMIAVQAELSQTPFDMPIAESELVSGYMTEYSGFRFLMFFIGEFASAAIFAFLASVLFLGGWTVPMFVTDLFGIAWDSNWFNVLGPLVMLTKMLLLTFVVYWVRFTFLASVKTNSSNSPGRC
ncbi:MAG: complex I subunit 1 family protein [Acidimicrobiales bacterium]